MFGISSIRRRIRRASALARLRDDERGVTLIEFGLLAVPFFMIIGAIIETAMIFFAAQVLDSAVGDASRYIRTGQAQSAGVGLSEFRALICDHLFGLFNCDDLEIKVSQLSSFTAGTLPQPVDPNTGAWKITPAYSAGGRNQVILVQVYYKWPTIMDFPGLNMANLPDGTRLLSSVRVFRNEPF